VSNSPVLEIVQQSFDELGLYPRPITAVGAQDQLTQQITALYSAVGQMLVTRRVWRGLLRQHVVTTPVPVTTLQLPSDYQRPINQAEWDRSSHWPLMGPMTPQQMATIHSGIISDGPRTRFRLLGNTVELSPASAANQTFVFGYVSSGWVVHNDGTGTLTYLTRPVGDADVAMFNDRLMVAGIKLRFNQAKGFDTVSFAEDFQVMLDDALAQDSGAQKLSMAAWPGTYLVGVQNVPDGSWAP
jgi:hypothetical protein